MGAPAKEKLWVIDLTKGNKEAFRNLFGEYAKRIFVFAKGYLKSNEEAAEALSNNASLYKVKVSTDPAAGIIQIHPAGDGTGYYLAWFTNNDSKKVWGPKQYLYPIPVGALNLNQQLVQNPGWENGATNDGK